jgi:hypothetical protein
VKLVDAEWTCRKWSTVPVSRTERGRPAEATQIVAGAGLLAVDRDFSGLAVEHEPLHRPWIAIGGLLLDQPVDHGFGI